MGILHGDTPGRTIAWRADIDALPLTELLEAPFASGTPGIMHACGHDGHTAIAITLAEILAARRADVSGTAVFLFQPAEEVFGGARPMIEAGVLVRRAVTTGRRDAAQGRVEVLSGIGPAAQVLTARYDNLREGGKASVAGAAAAVASTPPTTKQR